MPSKKTKLSQKLNKRGRPKKIVKKTTSDESTSNQNGDVLEIDNVMTNTNELKNDSDRIAELQKELQKAEQSKRVLYNALVRERSLNNDKPSVASAVSKTGHNFCKPYSALSADQKKERIRLLASVVAEFADPKGNSTNKPQEVKFVIESLSARWQKSPSDFQ